MRIINIIILVFSILILIMRIYQWIIDSMFILINRLHLHIFKRHGDKYIKLVQNGIFSKDEANRLLDSEAKVVIYKGRKMYELCSRLSIPRLFRQEKKVENNE